LLTFNSKQHSDDVYSSFDIALSKIEIQLRKYKSKLKDRSHKVKVSEITPEAIKYVISPSRAGDNDANTEIDVDNPVIIAEKPLSISSLSVGEAVMKMDLENLPALMFKNSKTDKVSVVYYRKDGNISWVESK
jgi:predicted ATP-grasp superfamily ATP-dependent carboligase